MWTYMMAAARGDRANSMMSNSRRRNETESPKYGYNLSRPLYRSSRLNGPAGSSSSSYPYATTTHYSSSGGGGGGGSSGASHMFHTHPYHQQHHLASTHALGGGGAGGGDDDYVSILTHGGGGGGGGGGGDDGTSLFSPLTPSSTTALALGGGEKDAVGGVLHMGVARRKHLIANHVLGSGGEEALIVSDGDGDDDDDEDGTSHGMPFGRHRMAQQQQQRLRQQRAAGKAKAAAGTSDSDADDDDDHGIDDDDDLDDDDEDEAGEKDAGGENDDDDDDDDADEALKNAERRKRKHADYLHNMMEKGSDMMPQDQTKRGKPSALRRTLNALRQRLTRRNRSKPPDWFLERFSSANSQSLQTSAQQHSSAATTASAATAAANATAAKDNSKIVKTNNNNNALAPANLDGPASEIRGSSPLCNRLSVNPSLQSHYRWLSVVSLAVMYNIVFVVGRAVFWEINRNATALWYFLDYLCDFIYLVDTLVHMHEGYLDQGLLVRDAYKLRRHYFHTKGWSIDLLSMLPTDLIYLWWPPSTCSAKYLPCPVIVRLNRLLRLPRMWEWFDRTETATGYPNAFRICKVVLAILVLIHWNACMYFAISYCLGFGSDNWVYNLNGYRNSTLQRQYIYSFYWSTLTLTTIGETPTPENDAEYMFVVADFLAGVLIFATIVGNIGSMISNMNVARVEFQNRMDGVKQYMAFRRVGHELEARVIRWFAYTWSQSGALDEERVLAALPDKLKAEIAIQVHMDTLKQVRIFHDCEPGLLEALVLKLKLQVFSPGDYICRKGDVGKEMYIVKRGKLSVVADDGVTVFATLGAGSVFGEVSVLEIAGNRTGNRRTANVRSLGYSDLFCLAKRDLWETLADYPEARAMLTKRGCELLRKDGLLDEEIFSDSQRVHDSIEGGIEKLEMSVENLNVRLARLLAEYTASQAKLKQRLAKLELHYQLANTSTSGLTAEPQTRPRSGRLYSLQPKRRPRPRPITASKSIENKQNTL